MCAAVHAIAMACLLQADSPEASLATKVSRTVSAMSDRLQQDYEATLALRPDRSRFENAYVVTTRHYRVRCNDSFAVTRLVADTLEKMREQFQLLLDTEPRSAQPANAFVYRTMEEYNQFGANNGAHHSSNYGGFFSTQNAERPAATYIFPQGADNPIYTRQWATHAAFHQYLAAVAPTALPTWLEEGLASFFELHLTPNAWTGFIPDQGETWQKGLPVPLSRLLHDGVEVYDQDHYKEIGIFLYYLMYLREDTKGDVFRGFLKKAVRGEIVADSPVIKAISGDADALEKEFILAIRKSRG